MKEKLKQSEIKYRKIFENATEGIIQSTPEGRLIVANPAFFKMLGYNPKGDLNKFINLKKQLYVNPEDRDKFKRILEKNGHVEGYEVQVKRKDGKRIWILLNTRSIKNKEGKIIFYEGTVKDITEKKKAEEELRESEKRYRLLVENIKDIVFNVNVKGIITYVNRSIKSVMGYNPKEVIGKNFSDFIYSEDSILLEEMIKNKQTGYDKPYEIRVIGKDGRICWVESHSIKFIRENGKLKETQGVIRDITDRKETEKRLIDSYKHLGLFNRQVDILSKLNEDQDYGTTQYMLNRVLLSSMELFQSNASLLYKCDEDLGDCEMISSIGLSKKQSGNFIHGSELAKTIKEKRSQIYGSLEEFKMDKIPGLRNLKKLHIIPIIKDNKMKAFILMFFNKKKEIFHSELFGEIFSFQVHLILENLKII